MEIAPKGSIEYQINTATLQERLGIGKLLMEVYTDAKKAIPAFLWPPIHLAHLCAESLDLSGTHKDFMPETGAFAYVNPSSHQQLLLAIVAPAKVDICNTLLNNCLAASLRVDGSVDRRHIDNIYVALKIVTGTAEEKTIFIGFEEPEEEGRKGIFLQSGRFLTNTSIGTMQYKQFPQ